jgi:hypothetical protein
VLSPNLKGGAAQKLVAKLIELGFVEEIRTRGDLPVWRRDDDHRPMALRITQTRPQGDCRASEGSGGETRPIRVDTRSTLVTAIARGRLWLSEIKAGTATIDDIAAREDCSTRHVT